MEKYRESDILREIEEYVANTYVGHYRGAKIQVSELIIDSGHATGFFMGNIMKYAQRYGKKGNSDEQRKDLMKIIHYAMMAIHQHDLKHAKRKDAVNNDSTQLLIEDDPFVNVPVTSIYGWK